MEKRKINPLLFSPSVRNIPAVLELWEKLPYDHLIEKYKMPLDAYQSARKFFLEHKEYTHIVVMADDLEVRPENIEQLKKDIIEYDYKVIGGICNIDESQPTVYNIQPVGSDYSQDHAPARRGSWYSDEEDVPLPDENIFEVGFNGFALLFVERSVFEKCSFEGAANGKQSNFDWQLNRECNAMGIPIMTDKRVKMYHRRMEQYDEAKAFKNRMIHIDEGHTVLLKNGKKHKIEN